MSKRLMRKFLIITIALFCAGNLFANSKTKKLEQKILENPNVIEVDVSKNKGEFNARITLTNDRKLTIIMFDENLSGELMYLDYIGEYEFYGRTNGNVLSILFNKEIRTVIDIINNYDEICDFAATLAKETLEERTRRKENGDKIFARRIAHPYEGLFADDADYEYLKQFKRKW